MGPRIDVITLAVADLDRALAFYRDGLGLPSRGIVGTEWPGDERTPAGAVAMFELRGGALLCLYPCTELAKDAAVELGPRAAASSVLATSSAAGPTSMPCLRGRSRPVRSSPMRRTTGRGASTRATSGILTPSVGGHLESRDPSGVIARPARLNACGSSKCSAPRPGR
jgi:catechol 2,3-dioxygenase-like lactoylglutathione lyase family enzyme